MAVHPNEGKITFSNLQGLEQRFGACDSAHVLDCLNVEFQDGIVQRRKGRQQLANTFVVKPTVVMAFDGVGPAINVTRAMTDGDLATTVVTNAFSTTSKAIYVAAPFRFAGAQFTLSAFASTNSTINTRVFQFATAGFGAVLSVVDGTAVASNTMKQNGSILLNPYSTQIITPTTGGGTSSAWTVGIRDAVAADFNNLANVGFQDFYWMKFSTTAGITGVNISEIMISMVDATAASLLTESNGMVEFTTKSNNRLLVSTNEYPGVLNSNYIAATSQNVMSEARATYFDLGKNIQVPIPIPASIRIGGVPGRKVSYVTFNGWLIGCTSNGYLWKFDGDTSDILEAKVGLDLQNNVIGAQSYLNQTPRGTMLEVYQSRLMVTGDPANPLAFHASMFDNNISVIPPDATVGGPNLWPLATAFMGLPARDGDYITGTSVINNLYVIFTKSRTFTWDGNITINNTNADVGCIATGSIQRTNNTVYFLSDDGFYQTDGISISPVSIPIWKFLSERVSWSSIQNATSAYDKTRGEYKCWLPINGEPQNQFCVVYNIKTGSWRFAAGWYPWDTDARRDANSVVQSVSATCPTTGSDGRKLLASEDSNGILWHEEVGRDDNGVVFPAFINLPSVASQGQSGEDYINLREWYITLTMDGQWFECYQLGDGDRFDQELDRRFANVATNSSVVQKQADTDNSVATEVQFEYVNVAAWPVDLNYAKPKKLKFSFGRNLTKMQPIIHWAPGQYVAGTYTTGQTPGVGKVYDIQIGVSAKGDGR